MLPPYATAMGMRIDRIDPEQPGDGPLVAMPWADHLLGRPGFVQGGAIAGVLEMAGYVALRHALAGETVTVKPINFSIDFMRGGRLLTTLAVGRVNRLGKRIANVETIAWQEDRAKPIASARMTLLLGR